MSKSALASLTAQYTDSENEAERSPDSENSQASQVIIPKFRTSPKESPLAAKRSGGQDEGRKRKRSKKIRRLVSYVDDTIVSDDGNIPDITSDESESDEEEDESSRSMDTSSVSQSKEDESSKEMAENGGAHQQTIDLEKSSKYAHYKFSLPPESKGKPSTELVNKVNLLYEKINTTNMDMNNIIQRKKEFRNPSIYEKLIQFCEIYEFGTNYPPEIYDPLQWGPESFYEELAKVQKNEMLKRQKERKDDKIEQATALARKVEEEAKKRKSKWDQPAAVRPPVPAPLTTTVTGTKGTVISAFGQIGTIPKKAA